MDRSLVPQATSDMQLIELWLHGRAGETQHAYARDVARFLDFANKPMRLVTLGDMQDFADSLANMAVTSQARALAAVKSLWAFGARLHYLPTDVGAALRKPGVPNILAERILAEDEVQRLLSKLSGRNYLIALVLYNTGLRISELCGLKWRNLHQHGDAGVLTVVGKGAKARAVPLSQRVYALLLATRTGVGVDSPIFLSRKGGHLDTSAVERIISQAGKDAGIAGKVSPHWLRHSCASHAAYKGAPIHLIQQQLGHESMRTTGQYLHTRPGDCLGNYLD